MKLSLLKKIKVIKYLRSELCSSLQGWFDHYHALSGLSGFRLARIYTQNTPWRIYFNENLHDFNYLNYWNEALVALKTDLASTDVFLNACDVVLMYNKEM